MRKNYKKLISDLSRLPRFNIPDKSRHCDDYGECRSFYMRWFYQPEHYEIQFAQKKTFDRWANSINFVCHLSYLKEHYRPDIVKMHLWAEKVCRSGLFNFNHYCNQINLPWMNPIRNKDNHYAS